MSMGELTDRYRIEIRRGPLRNNEAALSYRFAVERTLQAIHFVDSGRLLLEAIRETGKWLWIEPYQGSRGTCNAETTNVDTVQGKRHFKAWIAFTPDTGDPKGPCAESIKKGKSRGLEPSELLHHELLHAFRYMTGFRLPITLSEGLKGFKNNEELYAVLATNVFMTDPTNVNKTGARKDWVTWEPIDPDMDDSLSFYASDAAAFNFVENFCKDADKIHNKYTQDLSGIRSKYNPITVYFKDRDKAQALSKILKGLNDLEWKTRNIKLDIEDGIRKLEKAEQKLVNQSRS